MGFGDFAVSMQTRDFITKLVENVVDRVRPSYRYGRVVSVDGPNSKATVVFTGDTNQVIVNYASHVPVTHSIVRVEGIGTDRYIADIVGGSMSTQPSPVRYTIPALSGTWTNYSYGTHHLPGHFKTSEGIVVLTGLVGTGTVNTVIYTLPVGYRPDSIWVFIVKNSGVNGYLYVYPDGRILSSGGGQTYVSFEGIMFPAAGVATWTDIGSGGSTWASGWSSYHTSDPTFPVAGFWRDTLGRVWIRGLMKQASPSTVGAITAMFTLPFQKQWSSHYPTFAGGGSYGTVICYAGATATMQAHVGTNTAYVSCARATFVDQNIRGVWTPMPAFMNAWQNYGSGFPNAMHMKFADGIVMSDGLISSGTIGQTSQSLPPGALPDAQYQTSLWGSGKMIFIVAANLAEARTDLYSSDTGPGVLRSENDGSNIWRSLAGINYLVAG